MNIIKKIATLLEEKKKKLNESAKPIRNDSDDGLIGLDSANVANLIVIQSLIDDSDERRSRESIYTSDPFNGAGCFGSDAGSDSHSSSYESSCDSSSDSSCGSSCE